MKALQDSSLGLKQEIAELISGYAQNEKNYSMKHNKLRISLDYLKMIAQSLTDVVARYRTPELITSVLRPLDTLCFNRYHIVRSA